MIFYIIILYITLAFHWAVSEAHMALYRPIPRGGLGSVGGQYSATVLSPIKNIISNGALSCLRFRNNAPILLRQGDIYDIKFYSGGIRAMSESEREHVVGSPYKNTTQGRHGGGECRFYISYDNGVTGREIALYTKTCPDIHFFCMASHGSLRCCFMHHLPISVGMVGT